MNPVKKQLEHQIGAQEWTKIIENQVWNSILEKTMMTNTVVIWNPIWFPIFDKTREELK